MLKQEEIIEELIITNNLIHIEGYGANEWQKGYKEALLVVLEENKSEQINKLKETGIDFKKIVEILESENK